MQLFALIPLMMSRNAVGTAVSRTTPQTLRPGAFVQTWEEAAAAANAKAAGRDTPVKRVVGLLKEMQATLETEMKDDESLYDKLACWCNNNEYEKDEAIEMSQAKISDLNATIKGLTARSEELSTSISELEAEVSQNKATLAEATALREKQQTEAHGAELDSTQAIENLKAAIEVLSKHHGASFPQLSLSLLAVGDKKRDAPWAEAHESSHASHVLAEFMRRNGFPEDSTAGQKEITQHFLQQDVVKPGGDAATVWSADEGAVVRAAMRSAAQFVQAHHGAGYYPSYSSQSGEIMGVLKQLKEEMEGDLSEAQKLESSRAAAFAELRAAKVAEIDNGEKMAEKKEDELATTNNDLAHAKEDLAMEVAALDESQVFLANLKDTCADADSNFAARKKARMDEIQAVSETIAILMKDEARDTISDTYSFLQQSQTSEKLGRKRQHEAAATLRRAAAAVQDPKLSVLATAVELDAFTKVKKAIDDMIARLKVEESDEVKKNDWCKSELQETAMTTSKTESLKADLEAKEATLESNIKALEEGIAEALKQISELQLNLQRANEDRQKENIEFQKTVAEQTATVGILKEALERLAKYYDEAALLQTRQRGAASKQTPPVPQAEYAPSKAAPSVMQLIEKLIGEAKEMTASAKKSESEAQAAYEQAVANTNDSVSTLQKEVAAKTKTKAQTSKEKIQTGSDIVDTVNELEGLSKYTINLHEGCDYLLKNFNVRQEARAQEIEALQQAKQILSGASLS